MIAQIRAYLNTSRKLHEHHTDTEARAYYQGRADGLKLALDILKEDA